MNLYLISQDENNNYDTYDSAVVAAKNIKEAQLTEIGSRYSWTTPANVRVELIGKAKPNTEAGVILASFNAG